MLSGKRCFLPSAAALWCAALVASASALRCMKCNYNVDAGRCLFFIPSQSAACGSSRYCVMTALSHRDASALNLYDPAIPRDCDATDQQADHDVLWDKRIPSNPDYICKEIQHDLPDRTCICLANNCNNKTWDEIMQLPLVPSQPGAPYIPTLGANSADEMGVTSPMTTVTTTVSTDTGSDQTDGSDGSSKNTNSSKSSGPNLGAIIGGVVGGLALLGLLAAALWWFLVKRRKKKKPEEDEGQSQPDTESKVRRRRSGTVIAAASGRQKSGP
ncbi:uncharacterized protein LOC129600803 isoform X2 [Paramacrobiotus metropolitanus]|uniref:uncharacterized protein LOC129600803 isoform X2 n=1 Tax=Paramacrobiotus metropolitanus TaxID=2943436 RepID=UPI0024463F33|nr:uncharacterized protein LOC129600803 isoform X2 [Paramacrobiotus metropolitanus]